MQNKKKKDEKKQFAAISVTAAVVIFIVVFFVTFFVHKALKNNENNNTESVTETTTEYKTEEITADVQTDAQTTKTTTEITTTVTTEKITQNEPEWTGGAVIQYPSDTASWELICVNKYRYVDSASEDKIYLTSVAGSSEKMDERAAEAYDKMYAAAKADGYYLTPCSGYRSYSTQKRLYNEFVYEYMNQGYSESEAHDLASRRRNPPGSSEHNLGICMDIICASSSANFQNTEEYSWLCENAHKYGFVLRYPEDKADVTGVKFEPWHWRYVGVENAEAIKNSGLCLEEYLSIV